MITRERIAEMQKGGEVIITNQTFKKSVAFKEVENGEIVYEYKGKIYRRHDWLLTYGHEQYQRLVP